MELKSIVLHHIAREQHAEAELNLSDTELPINDLSNEFVKKLIKNYSSKNSIYGKFEKNNDLYPFQNYVSDQII